MVGGKRDQQTTGPWKLLNSRSLLLDSCLGTVFLYNVFRLKQGTSYRSRMNRLTHLPRIVSQSVPDQANQHEGPSARVFHVARRTDQTNVADTLTKHTDPTHRPDTWTSHTYKIHRRDTRTRHTNHTKGPHT
jgi:hypothetical protein